MAHIDEERRKDNWRTGLILLSIAAAFFFGIIYKYWS
jgi:hypothetical protein